MDLSVAGVNVNAVNRERLEPRDLQLTLRHGLLNELKLSLCRHPFSGGATAVTGGLGRGDSAAVGVQAVATRVSGIGDAKEISTTAIWWPGGKRENGRVGMQEGKER